MERNDAISKKPHTAVCLGDCRKMIYCRLRRIFVRLQGAETGADSKLCNGFRNAEGGRKDKQEAGCHLTEIALPRKRALT